jgi:hypothetical protein
MFMENVMKFCSTKDCIFSETEEHETCLGNISSNMTISDNLFGDNYRYTGAAQACEQEVYDVLIPIMERYTNMGYSPREISHIMIGATTIIESENVLSVALDKRKKVIK